MRAVSQPSGRRRGGRSAPSLTEAAAAAAADAAYDQRVQVDTPVRRPDPPAPARGQPVDRPGALRGVDRAGNSPRAAGLGRQLGVHVGRPRSCRPRRAHAGARVADEAAVVGMAALEVRATHTTSQFDEACPGPSGRGAAIGRASAARTRPRRPRSCRQHVQLRAVPALAEQSARADQQAALTRAEELRGASGPATRVEVGAAESNEATPSRAAPPGSSRPSPRRHYSTSDAATANVSPVTSAGRRGARRGSAPPPPAARARRRSAQGASPRLPRAALGVDEHRGAQRVAASLHLAGQRLAHRDRLGAELGSTRSTSPPVRRMPARVSA